jgi:hypothetical protein
MAPAGEERQARTMSKTMTANIPGARLREVDRELAKARGEAAVNAVIEAYPNEAKVLQQLVEWRRAGKSVPPLARVQRAMLWSDNSIELSAAAASEAPARGGFGGREAPRGRGGVDGARRPAPSGAGGAGSGRSSGPQQSGRGPSPRPGGPGRPGGAGSTGRDRFAGRPGDRRDGTPGGPRQDGTRRYVFGEGQEGAPRPAARRGRPGGRRDERDGEGRNTYGLPHAGEGWVLLREGEAPPPGPTLGGVQSEEAPNDAVAEPRGTEEQAEPQEAR